MDGAALPPAGAVPGTPGSVTDGEVTEVGGAGTAWGWIPSGSRENAAELLSNLGWKALGRAEIPGDIPAWDTRHCHRLVTACPLPGASPPRDFPLPQGRVWSRERGVRWDEGGITPNLP